MPRFASPFSCAAALCLVVAPLLAAPLIAGEYRGVHGVDGPRFDAWFQQATKDGYRTVFVSGIEWEGKPIFAAVAVKDGKNFAFQVRHGLSPAGLQETFDRLVGQGYRQTCISGYRQQGELKYVGVWTKDGTENAWESRVDMTSAKYQETFNRCTGKGMTPVFFSGYANAEGEGRIAAIFRNEARGDWSARHDLTDRDYQKAVTENAAKKFRPLTLGVYPSAQGPLYGAVFIKDANSWVARHNLTADAYQQQFDAQAKNGFRPECIVPYIQEKELRYAAIWIKDIPESPSLSYPPSGREVAELKGVEEALLQFMRERRIPCATLAIAREGEEIVYSRGFGYADKGRKRVIQPDDPFRLASVVKPITAAAVRKLIAEKKIHLGDKAFDLIDVDYPRHFAPADRDPRLEKITLDHLLSHRGGWDRNKAFDPMFRTWEIAEALKRPAPPGPKEVIAYMLGQKLQFMPGSQNSYSNFGYCVLGRVIEHASGKPYEQYVRQDLLAPLKIKTIELGRSLPEKRNPREPWYSDPGQGDNVMLPKPGTLVARGDGDFYLEAMDSHGGLIGSAPDLVRFLDAYWISGHPREGKVGQEWTHFGSLPGTYTMARQRKDGVNIAVLFNQRTDVSGKDYGEILRVLDRAIDSVTTWPVRGK